jgi:hypothetical protein
MTEPDLGPHFPLPWIAQHTIDVPPPTAADVLARRLSDNRTVVTDLVNAIDTVMGQLKAYPRLPKLNGTGTPFVDRQLVAAEHRANGRSWRGELTWLEILRLYAIRVDAAANPRNALVELAAFAMLWANEIDRLRALDLITEGN